MFFRLASLSLAGVTLAIPCGCTPLNVLNPSFINQSTGAVFPLTPGERSGFILVRANNSSQESIEFLVTIERTILSDVGGAMLATETSNFRLFAPPDTRANDIGVLVDCPVARIGLGEDLNRPATEPAIFVGAEDVGVGGIGVPAQVNPLSFEAGNFDCGDTIIFQVIAANGSPGGVRVNAFVLDAEGFSSEVSGIDTFMNVRSLIEEQIVPTEGEE